MPEAIMPGLRVDPYKNPSEAIDLIVEALREQDSQQHKGHTRSAEIHLLAPTSIQNLQKRRHDLDLKYHYLDLDVQRLAISRDRMHKLVDDIFNAHENALRMHIRSQYKIDQPDTTKLRMAIEEMEKVLMKLGHSTTVLPALKKGLLLDHNSLV